MERAAGRRRERRRRLACEVNTLTLRRRIGDRRRREQRLRIGVLRCLKDRLRPHLDRVAEIDDQNVVGDVPYDREIVRNVHRQADDLQAGKQVQNLCADRNVERETGSSSTRILGLSTRARAMAMRWRWPPENMCG